MRAFPVRAVFAVCLSISALLYGNSLYGDFIYDDEIFSPRAELRDWRHLDDLWLEPYVHDNPGSGLYRPLSIFTLSLNYVAFGESPVSFHAANILLHGLVALLLFLVTKRLAGRDDLAAVAALLFLFLPIHSEAVASIKSRDELLAALFAFCAWLAFLRGMESRKWTKTGWLALAGAAYLFALLSKELIALAPGISLVSWHWRHHPRWREWIAPCAAFGIAFAAYAVLRFAALGTESFASDDVYFVINPMQDADLPTQWSTGLSLFWFALGKTIAPWNLSATYHFDQLPLVSHPFASPYSLLGLLALAGSIAALFFERVRSSAVGLGIATFLVPYVLFSKLIFKHGDIFAERWLYFASAGVCIVMATGFVRLRARNRFAALALLTFVLSAYAAVLIPRNAVWLNRYTLGMSMIETAPKSIQGYTNVARHLLEIDQPAAAAPYIAKGMEIYPNHPPLLAMLGLLALQNGDTDVAKQALERAIAIRPEFDAVYLLAVLQAKQGLHADSITTVQAYLPHHQEHPQVRALMAVNLYRMGEEELALSLFQWDPSMTREQMIETIESF